MARRTQCRRIGAYPDCWLFSPEEGARETVQLSLDEYECIRLLDREGLTQEQCAGRMGVGRTTVTAIYDSARKKIAEALVEGKALRIGGGSYTLNTQVPENLPEKGNSMRIAVCYENGEIFQHFGHTAQFKLYDVDKGAIVSSRVVDTNGSGHGALALAKGILAYDPNVRCDHHDHHGEDHDCSRHHEERCGGRGQSCGGHGGRF